MSDLGDIEDNPLLDYLVETRDSPAACVEPWLAYGLGMVSLVSIINAITAWEFRIVATQSNDIWWYAVQLTWPAGLLLPPLSLLVALNLTAMVRNRPDVFDLIRVSGLSSPDIIRAISAASYFWLRGWVMWLFGYSMLFAGGVMYLNYRVSVAWTTGLIKSLFIIAGLWLSMTLAIKIGIALQGFRRRQQWVAIPVLLMLWLVMYACVMVLVVYPADLLSPLVSEWVMLVALPAFHSAHSYLWHKIAVYRVRNSPE